MVFLAGNDTRRDLGCGRHLQVDEMKQQDRGKDVILRPSILCVTHQVSRKKRNGPVLGQYKLLLLGIRWYGVSKGLVCLYIFEKVEIWLGDTDA